MAVITISRQYGSGGDEIAVLLSKNLGWQQFNKNLLTRAAMDAGFSDQEIIDYSEDNYQVRNFLDRLFNRERMIAQVRVWTEDASGVRAVSSMPLGEEHALLLVRKAIQSGYEAGNMVIVGRGGQMILKDKPDVLHVRIEAPKEERIYRMREALVEPGKEFASTVVTTDTVEARREAVKLVEEHDAASADYIKSFYDVNWADPLLYHLVINTGKISLEGAVHLITEAVNLL